MPYILIDINLINNLVRILLQRSCKNNNLIILCHQLNKLNTAWPYQKEAILAILHIMNQGLIQIQDQRVQVFFFLAL